MKRTSLQQNFDSFNASQASRKKNSCLTANVTCSEHTLHGHELSPTHKTTHINGFSFRGDDGQDNLVLLLVEADVLGVVEDTEKVGLDGVRVAGLTQNLQQRRVRHKEESWEGQTLLLQVTVGNREKRDLLLHTAIFFCSFAHCLKGVEYTRHMYRHAVVTL